MIIQTHDGKQFDVPQDKVEGFLKDYNNSTGFDPRKLSPDPEVNPERGVNFGGGARAFAQGLPIIGSYADEAEAWVRSQFGDKSYDEYLKNARESYEGAKENMPEIAYPLEIGSGILGETGLAVLTGGASLHPLAQGAMGAVYGYGMGEGDALNRTAAAGLMGTASAALPVVGGKVVKYGVKKPLEYFGKKIANKEMPALMKALIKPNSVEKTVVSTDLSKATGAIIDNINKVDVLPEEKPVVQTIVDALGGNSQKNGHLLLKDADAALNAARKEGVLSEDTTVNLYGALHDTPKTIEGKDAFTINNLRTLVNKGESIAEKTAVADDLLRNTTKVKSLYNTVNKDIDEMLALSWEDQLKDTFIDLQTKYAKELLPPENAIQRLYNKVLVATANSAEQGIKDSSNDLITRNLAKEIKNIVASESGLSKEFAQGLEDRIISEVLSRRTAASLAGKSLQASSEGLVGSVALDAAMGIGANAVLPGAGVPGALIRNVLPGNSSLSRVKGALKDKAVDSVIAKNVARDNTIAGVVTANEKGLLNRWGENEIKAGMKRGAKAAASRETAGQKIVNALKKPGKIVKEGIEEASKKPTKQLIKEALQVAPKTVIPVGIREATREVYDNGVIPFAAKPKREEPVKQQVTTPQEVAPVVQPTEELQQLSNPNNLSYNTIVLPSSEGDTSSTVEKFIRMIQALYPQYYQRAA